MSHKLEFTDEELDVLQQILQEQQQDELVELRRTDNANFKEHVRHHLHLLELLARLAGPLERDRRVWLEGRPGQVRGIGHLP